MGQAVIRGWSRTTWASVAGAKALLKGPILAVERQWCLLYQCAKGAAVKWLSFRWLQNSGCWSIWLLMKLGSSAQSDNILVRCLIGTESSKKGTRGRLPSCELKTQPLPGSAVAKGLAVNGPIVTQIRTAVVEGSVKIRGVFDHGLKRYALRYRCFP